MSKTRELLICMALGFTITMFGQGMYVSPGTNITIEATTSINVNSGDLCLAGNDTELPSLLQKGNIILPSASTCMIEQYLFKDEWHIISSPVEISNVSPFMGMYLMEYIEPTESWSYIVEETTPLLAGRGYFAWNPIENKASDLLTPDFIVYSGALNKTSIPISLYYTSSTTNPGWNMVGNPFPCSLEWNGHADWNLTNTGATIYVYDAGVGGGSSGNYRVFNYNNPPEAQVPEGNDGMISATQGFWINATAPDASITIPASQRCHSDKPFYKSSPEAVNNILRLKITDQQNGMYCETVIAFDEKSTGNFDADHDAYFIEGNSDAPIIYSSTSGTDYMVNFLPSYVDYKTVSLKFRSTSHAEITVVASGMESFPPDVPIYLEDKKDEMMQDIRQNSTYSFANLPGFDEERFLIHFMEPVPQGNFSSGNQVHIYSSGNTIYISFPIDSQGDIYIYNVLGEQVLFNAEQTGQVEIVINEKQNYIVKVISNNNSTTRKLCIQ